MTLEELALQGKTNIYDSMAAGVGHRLVELRNKSIRESLSDFENIEHKLEYVSQVHGVKYINDSKSTNVNGTWYALESMNEPVIWIAGGVDKGNDYTKILPLVAQKVKVIICLGLENTNIRNAFASIVPEIYEVKSAEDAVLMAYSLGKKGDTVLLSPACPSFDLFENYEDRGNKFKEVIKQL